MIYRRIIPCLLMIGNGFYKTTNFKRPQYIGDPINTIKLFNDMEVDEIVIQDKTAFNSGSINFQMLKNIATECFSPIAYGGGIKTIKEIQTVLQIGFEKVIINSSFFYNKNLIVEAIKEFGAQSIAVSVDYKRLGYWRKKQNIVFIEGGTVSTKTSLLSYIEQISKYKVGEVILTSIDQEGTRAGYDIETINAVCNSISIPVVPVGGASSYLDIVTILQDEIFGAGAGSIFVYHSKSNGILINYPNQKERECLNR